MAELLHDFLAREKVKEPTIIGRGILPVQGKLVIGGAPKRNKSFVAINMGLALAAGKPIFFAYFPSSAIPVLGVSRSYKTLYIEQEIGEVGLEDRLKHIPNIIDEPIPFFICSRDLTNRMDTEGGRAAIEREIELTQAEVLILDPLKKFHSMDENSAQQMDMIMRVGTNWVDKYGLSIIYVHHAGHQHPEHPREGGDLLRGSTTIYADADTVMIVEMKSPTSTAEPLLLLNYELRRGEPIPSHFVKRLRDGRIQFLGEGRIWNESERSGVQNIRVPEPKPLD